jgi:Xaa-Pro aminopeptidase
MVENGNGKRKISRRALLRRVSLGAASLPLVSMLRSEGAAQQRNEPPGLAIFKPSFTVNERDRRWSAIRRVMSRPEWNLDAIIALGSGDSAYPRYLAQIGGRGGSADVVFARDATKPVYALLPTERNKAFWEARLASWRADGRLILREGDGSKALLATITALGLNRPDARIGLAKLTGSRFDPEGLVSATYLDNLKKALSGASFLPIEKWGPDAGPIDEPAMLKSAEEHEVIRRSVAAGEAAIETIRRSARGTGKRQADVWFAAYNDMFARTGEEPTRLSIAFDQGANTTLGAPVEDPLRAGQIISQEIDATYQGYRGQVNHSIFVGGPNTPGYLYYRAAMEAAIRLFFDCMKFIVPEKTTCGALADYYAAAVEKMNAEDQSGVVIHSSGIANLSRPRIGPANSRGDASIALVPGMAFDFKPAIRLKRAFMKDLAERNRVVQVGDHVLITDAGAVRLGRRELTPITTEA